MTIERVVFLPGASGDAGFWAPVAQRLPRALDSADEVAPHVARHLGVGA
jgi:hypothetical protein